jgi:hypothetical protein
MNMEQLYQERLQRYVAAMRNEQPDRVPIRPFVAEFTAKYAGYTCQEVVHDFEKAFLAARKCACDFDWDAIVPNMVYVWTGLTQAIGLRYYGIPGIGMPPDTGFNYIEPPENEAFMRADEYDALIEDPTGFLFNVWFPRVCGEASAIGAPCTYRNNLSYLKGGMAMWHYFTSFGRQIALMRQESGTPSALAGIFKAPFDIIADKLRGYVGLTMDMHEQPEKVLRACEALMPHLCNVGLTTADPEKKLPIGFWMHRGCVPFITPAQFKSHYWPTLKPIIEEFWKNGYQTLFYAEGNWNAHLDAFAELPERSLVYHVDRADIFEVHRKLGAKFCLSGGIPNVLLSYGQPAEVRNYCKKVIDGVAKNGGYIMDASAIMQDDTSIENLRAMTDATREYGSYSGPAYKPTLPEPHKDDPTRQGLTGMAKRPPPRIKPGVCFPWEAKVKELPEITGDAELVKRIWESTDAFGNVFIWQVLLSF